MNIDVLKAAPFTHLQSHRPMSYGIAVWGHFGNVKKLLLLQKREVSDDFNVCSSKSLFKGLGILSIASLYILDCLLNVQINLDYFITNSSVHTHFTRKSHFLRPSQISKRQLINFMSLTKSCITYYLILLHVKL